MGMLKSLDSPHDVIENAEREVDLDVSGAMLRLAQAQGKVCGNCKYFSLHEGQKQIETQRFIAQLVKEHKWKVKYLGAPPETLGDCGAHRSGSAGDDITLTGPLHMACDQFREK
jgi:hypothetical protein